MLLVSALAFGNNMQLHLQSAFTKIGHPAPNRLGRYAHRYRVQVAFIAGLLIVGLSLLTTVFNLTWGSPSTPLWAFFGGACLMLLVIFKVASFHRVDLWLGEIVAGCRINWLLEIGELLVLGNRALRRGVR